MITFTTGKVLFAAGMTSSQTDKMKFETGLIEFKAIVIASNASKSIEQTGIRDLEKGKGIL